MWLAVMLASLAGGEAAPCAPLPPPPRLSAFEQKVRDGMDRREAYALRADRAWVIRVLRSPRTRVEEGFGPATPGEIRHLRLRDRIIEATAVIEAHLARQRANVDAGYSIVEGGNGGPFIVYQLSGDRERLEPELRARFPYPRHLRFRTVEFSTRDLDALVERVFEDEDALAREGIELLGGGAGSESNRAEIEVITARTDVHELFSERYGRAVAVEVEATRPYRLECTEPLGYRPSRTGRSLTIRWSADGDFVRTVVTESRRTVRVGIVERKANGNVAGTGAPALQRRVRLAAPLGSRRVVYARSGKRLTDLSERR